MTKKRWFRFYIDHWRNGTFGLAPNEIAAYIELLCELYDHDGFAKVNVAVMARRTGMRPTSFQKALNRLVALGKIDIEGGFLTSKAVTEEIKSREKVGEKSRESQQKAVEKRNENRQIREKLNCITESRIKKESTTSKDSALRPLTSADLNPTPQLIESIARMKAKGRA